MALYNDVEILLESPPESRNNTCATSLVLGCRSQYRNNFLSFRSTFAIYSIAPPVLVTLTQRGARL